MSKLALDPINLLQSAGSPTGAFRIGDTYFDSSANAIYVYNGTTWVQNAALSNTQTFTAAQTIAPTSTSVVPFTINLPSGSSQNLINLQNQGITYFSVAAFGYTTIVAGFNSGSSSSINSANATAPIFKVKNAASQTADIQQNLNSSNTVLSGTNAAGQIYAGTTAGVVGNTSTNLTSAAYTSATVAVFTYGGTSLIAAGQTVTVAGVTGGTYNGTWIVSAATTTTFTVLGSGFTNVVGSGGTVQISAVISSVANTAAVTPLIVKGAASQTANLQQWQNSAGTVLVAVGANGTIATGTTAGAPTIASAATITPVTPIVFVSGVATINTITPPAPISTNGGQITLIPTGIFTTGVSGNIAIASTAVVSRALILTYDPITTKWYPSY